MHLNSHQLFGPMRSMCWADAYLSVSTSSTTSWMSWPLGMGWARDAREMTPPCPTDTACLS